MSGNSVSPKFKSEGNGIEIIDPIERCRYQLQISNHSTPVQVEKDQVGYSVDSAVEITTSSITVPDSKAIYVLNHDEKALDEVIVNNSTYLSYGEYTIDLSRQIKVYILFESSVKIISDRNQKCLCFDDPTRITIGARSFHTRPADTITTTSSPRDVMRAVSTFGSALKTTTPEQSFPTLRGHPPTLKLGNELTVPDKFSLPDNGVRIEIEPTLDQVFTVAPLAYYLGAEVVPGSEPKLLTEKGYKYSFSYEGRFESTVERTLKQVFFLDCIVRTEGGWPGPLYERKTTKPILGFDISSTYKQSLADRIKTYLEIPYSTIEPYLHDWQLKVQISPDEPSVEFLPFLAYDLAIVSTKIDQNSCLNHPQIEHDITKSQPISSSPAINQYWKCRESSKTKSTVPLSGLYNRIERSPRIDPLDINVICNDQKMTEELINVYGSYREQESLLNVNVYKSLDRKSLREVLKKESDFVHYIGHIDADGFRCIDGNLCASSLDMVGTKAFFLNACRSFTQGIYLIEAGSIGGIVTSDDIVNMEAIHIGNTVSRFLDNGHPLYVAVEAVRNMSKFGHLYQLVGDGTSIISQSEDSVSKVCSIKRDSTGFTIKLKLHQGITKSKGGIYRPDLQFCEHYHLVPGEVIKNNISKPQLVQFLDREKMPVVLDGELRWSDEIKISEL
ncbi:hypothetical protein [Halosolutus gelatinilyticus]|uniref:hypothetical protein n=1 Tax=Halosolutus gelatinilyticus TaxID=2931975 RepID=UPI001FF2B518|nr:hypothetical protein [Halosolutus gelatinilyticus]